MRFRSTILEQDGSTVDAELDAPDAQALHDQLHRQGRTLLRVRTVDSAQKQASTAAALSPRRLLLLTQALQEALDAGVPLLATLDAVGEQEEDPRLSALLADLQGRIAEGQLLSDALRAHPRAFPPVFCALVQAGEQSGSLPRVLQSITTFLEWRLEIAGIVRQAAIYPIVVAVAGYGMMLFLLSFVIPRLGSVLDKIGSELPAASRLLIDGSGFVAQHIVAIVVASVVLGASAFLAMRTRPVREAAAAVLAVLPVVRSVLASLAVAQFCRTFSVLLHAGLTMPHALELSARSVVTPAFRGKIDSARQRILGGTRLAEAAQEIDLLPPVALSMVKVGEEAGRLPVTFERLGRLYDREVKESVKRALTLLEPAVTVVLGIVVGGVAVLVVGTIYSAMRGIGR